MVAVHDKKIIQRYLENREPGNFAFQHHNLEGDAWSDSQWFGLQEQGEVKALAMWVLKYELPVLIGATGGVAGEDYEAQCRLLAAMSKYLPIRLYSHLDIGAAACLGMEEELLDYCRYYNMRLTDRNQVLEMAASEAEKLSQKDRMEVIGFLQMVHPGHLPEYDYITEGFYWGIREKGELVCVAGINAKSEKSKLVALGPVATHPNMRGRGLARQVTGALIQDLMPRYEHIVLNVKEKNTAAVSCYKHLGFQVVGRFEEVIR